MQLGNVRAASGRSVAAFGPRPSGGGDSVRETVHEKSLAEPGEALVLAGLAAGPFPTSSASRTGRVRERGDAVED